MKLFQLEEEILKEIIENPEKLFEIEREKYEEIDLNKSWEGLNFLLSKVNKFLSNLIFPYQEIDGIEDITSDVYDVNYLNKEQVHKLSEELNKLEKNQFNNLFDYKEMNRQDIYGNPFNKESFDYFIEYFLILKSFYENASKNENAIIFFVS